MRNSTHPGKPHLAHGDRIEVVCDGFSHGDEIVSAVGDNPSNKLVVLAVSTELEPQNTKALIDGAPVIAAIARRVRILISLPDSIDGTDIFREGSTAAQDAVDLTESLSDVCADLAWNFALTNENVWRLDSVYSLARSRNVPLVVTKGTEPLHKNARLFAWDFITYRLIPDAQSTTRNHELAYLTALQGEFDDQISDKQTSTNGLPQSHGKLLTEALVESQGNKQRPPRDVAISEVPEVAWHLLQAHLTASISSASASHQPLQKFDRAVLVGAYGGEHIGDMAILGGILFRMHREFGLKKAVLMTQRPAHTRHLVGLLETPVEVTVVEYTFPEIKTHISNSDALIHAGGPLTDIPKQLIRHLYAAGLAKRLGVPYLIEGVGPTTFKRSVSRITARRLVKLADRIVVRTSTDASSDIIRGLEVQTGHDPAFDYLETRNENLTRLLPGELSEIQSLLNDTTGRPVVGINIRPINDLFTPSESGQNRASRTREVEDQMEQNLAKGLVDFAEQCKVKPVFIFFPMNAIQFGKSDNHSAFRIVQHLPSHIDARVWHSDASLDAVVTLIRRLDTVVSMRFHATIFALSQNCLPIGIDYRIGMKYKVSAVMEDANQSEFCCRIDEVESQWITERLHERLTTATPTSDES